MIGPKSFVSRWMRLKSQSGAGHDSRLEVGDLEHGATRVPDLAPDAADREADGSPEGPFDTARLPAIETIKVDTDIEAFLQSGVPAELTRAALRQAWASDPAIRDFIGIAENQWDFNDPNAMPGFSALNAEDKVADLRRQVLGEYQTLGSSTPVSVAQVPSSASECRATDPARTATPGVPSEPDLEATTIEEDLATEEYDSSPWRASHGGALPT
ncbi:DUF3306 domain-containing protein [Bradyrhizobium sp. 139]|uniref:DUF3306 domain-containing protein n=1 Tax=Bradyrhizobium sp. 139 TaxID=2782616 RepID=UPI001FF9CC11|nr:DUF3306 domain-containing protein [Bradyrhizobium sp. 139]